MRKKLSLAQLAFLAVSAILPLVDGMFKWIATNLYRDFRYEDDMSLHNLSTVQEVGLGPVAFYIFYILLGITVLSFIVSLFNNKRGKDKVVLLALLTILMSIMIFSAGAYYIPLQGLSDTTAVMVDIQWLGFLEIGVLAVAFIMEIYKLYVCKE